MLYGDAFTVRSRPLAHHSIRLGTDHPRSRLHGDRSRLHGDRSRQRADRSRQRADHSRQRVDRSRLHAALRVTSACAFARSRSTN